jgi:hypothetical protein
MLSLLSFGCAAQQAVRTARRTHYDGRIVIDTARLEFRAVDLVSDRPVDSADIGEHECNRPLLFEL